MDDRNRPLNFRVRANNLWNPRWKKKQGTQGDEYHLLWQMRHSIRSLFFGRRGWNRNDRCFFKRSLGSPVIMGRVIGVGYCETSAYRRRSLESALNNNRLEFQAISCTLKDTVLRLCSCSNFFLVWNVTYLRWKKVRAFSASVEI